MATDNDFRMWEQELGRIDEHDEAALSELFEAVGDMLAPLDADEAAEMFEAGGHEDAARRARNGVTDLTVRELLAACLAQSLIPAVLLCDEGDGEKGAELIGIAAELGRSRAKAG